MRKSRFSKEQIIKILKEHAAGLSAGDLCRKYGISDATFYKWRSRYGGMDVSDAAPPMLGRDEHILNVNSRADPARIIALTACDHAN